MILWRWIWAWRGLEPLLRELTPRSAPSNTGTKHPQFTTRARMAQEKDIHMNRAAKARLTTYLTGLMGFIGLALAGYGLAEFDPVTGVIDFAPFNAYALIAALPGALATIVAPIALIKGWGAK